MIRVKSFDSTGLAPNGALYAGDLDLIQDVVAAQNDFTQSIALSSLQIGESALQLLRFGSGEARLTGALRTDGVLRGLGGFLAGAYTAAQRDTIPAGQGKQPFSIIIFNTTTNRYEWNTGTDTSPNWQPLSAGTAKVVVSIGDGTSKVFVIQHGLGSQDVFVQVRSSSSPYTLAFPEIDITDANNITLQFASTPPSGGYIALILAPGLVQAVLAHAGTHVPGGSDPINLAAFNGYGTATQRPAASSSNAGMLHFTTDIGGGTLFRSNGVTWQKIAKGLTE